MSHEGVMDAAYAERRKTVLSHRYRLKRRAQEIAAAVRRYRSEPVRWLLDIGTADGLGLHALRRALPEARVISVEYAPDLVQLVDRGLNPVRADAVAPPVRAESVDVIVAAAVVEHLDDIPGFFASMRDRLTPGGLLLITTPDPRWDHVAELLGTGQDEHHTETLNLRRLRELSEGAGLQVAELRKFMVSPVGMPLEHRVERVMRRLRLDPLLLNQLLVARRHE